MNTPLSMARQEKQARGNVIGSSGFPGRVLFSEHTPRCQWCESANTCVLRPPPFPVARCASFPHKHTRKRVIPHGSKVYLLEQDR